VRKLLSALFTALLLLVPAASAHAIDCDGIELDDGCLFTATGSDTVDPDDGFAVTDHDDVPMWSFIRAQSLQSIGYPISQRWVDGPFTLQAFQKVILQWSPGEGRMNYYNTLDALANKYPDVRLPNVPLHQVFDSASLSFDQVKDIHLSILDRNSKIKTAFLAEPDWLNLFGLPIRYEEREVNGNPQGLQLLRAQRVVFEVWNVPAPGTTLGSVGRQNVPDKIKRLSNVIIPDAAELPVKAEPTLALSPPTPPTNPLSLNIESQSSTETYLTWTYVRDAPTRQDLYRDGELIATLGREQSSYTDSNLGPNRRYEYRLVLHLDDGSMDMGKGSAVTLANPPRVAGPMNVNLQGFVLPLLNDSNPPHTTYRVTVSDGTDTSLSDWDTSRCRAFDDLRSGAEYTFAAVARNINGIETEAVRWESSHGPDTAGRWGTQIRAGNSDAWVVGRINDIGDIYGLTDHAREWMLSDVQVGVLRDDPQYGGFFGPGYILVGRGVGPPTLLHELMHAFWSHWDDLPDNCETMSLQAFRTDVARFILEFRHFDNEGQSNPLEDWRFFFNYLTTASDHYRGPNGEDLWEMLVQERYDEIWNQLYHAADTEIPSIVAGNLSLIPPTLRPYFIGFLSDKSATTWLGELSWYTRLTKEDRHLWNSAFGYSHVLWNSPDFEYDPHSSEESAGIPEPLRQRLRESDRQQLVDFVNTLGDVSCSAGSQSCTPYWLAEPWAWDSYVIGNINRFRFYGDEISSDIGVELDTANLQAVRRALQTLHSDLYCGQTIESDIRSVIRDERNITERQRTTLFQLVEMGDDLAEHVCS